MVKTNLQSRLIILMVLSSVFLISTFTAIQLNNQLQRAAEFNLYRAKLGALITKDKLEFLASQAGLQKETRSVIIEVQSVFSSLVQSHVIETAVLLDKNAKPIVSRGKLASLPDYDALVLEKISQIKDSSRWLFPFVDKRKRLINLFIILENPYGYVVKLTFSLGNLQQALNEVYLPVVLTIIIVIVGNIILATLLSRALISPVKVLNSATKDIASGNLDRKISIATQDELEELAGTFNYMTEELKKMKAKAENANPLTKLPGNIVIQEEVEKRIKDNTKFVLIYSDLDNFKAFNDKYGVHAGDKAIMLTTNIMKEAIDKVGASDDFIGHEGGDDFLLLTVPGRAEKIGHYIIEEFDKRIRKLYSEKDLKCGYIEATSRESNKKIYFPIMTISLAGVTNLEKKIEYYAQLTNIAANVKKAAKDTKGSKFFIDRRIVDRGSAHRGKMDDIPT